MQSDIFLNDTDSDDEEYSSDSSGDLPKNNNIGVLYEFPNKDIVGERFADQSLISEYDKVRRNLFSKQLMKGSIYIQSDTYQNTSTFNTSNYMATFEGIKSVIGIQLKAVNLRVPQYNVNNTNNVIWYNDGSDHSVTINPGYYTASELSTALQETSSTKTHRVTYSGSAPQFTAHTTYYSANSTSTADKNGMIFKLVNNSAIKFLWSKNNITKGAARLFGFYPLDSSGSLRTTHHSDKPPDFSQHFVDMVIPEIPGIACKRTIFNGGRMDVIERIPLTYSTGAYQRYEPDNYNTNFFTPIKLNKLNIQLFSDNNEEFDSQNTPNSFEFEITILGA